MKQKLDGNVTDFTLEDWHKDILEYYAEDIEMTRPPDEDEFTKQDFCDLMKREKGLEISIKTAEYWLAKAVEEGKATVRQFRTHGSATNLYRWVKDEQHNI